jgi:predicted transcriptional regulator of viral defense system
MNEMIKSTMWIRILAELSERLQKPSADLPNIQWLSEPRLKRLLVDVRKAAKATPTLSEDTLLNMLIESKLAKMLNLDEHLSTKQVHNIYCLKLGSMPPISPVELLQTTQVSFDRSVICYFTALEYHELTTQEPPYYHIASLKKPTRPKGAAQLQSASGQTALSNRTPDLGTLLFKYEGVPYYVTYRDPRLIPGIQTVHLSSTCQVRMTTLEQTLLDTLHKPWSCGGPSVVFEAWERGLPLLDETRVLEYLKKIGRTDLTRRVGYMLENNNYSPVHPKLCKLLNDAKAKVKKGQRPTIPLLPDVPSKSLDDTWGVYT